MIQIQPVGTTIGLMMPMATTGGNGDAVMNTTATANVTVKKTPKTRASRCHSASLGTRRMR